MNRTTPNPGSIEAGEQGCICPVIDNGYGRGLYTDKNGVTRFFYREDCPLHAEEVEQALTKAEFRRV